MSIKRTVCVGGFLAAAALGGLGCFHTGSESITPPMESPGTSDFTPTASKNLGSVSDQLAVFNSRATELPAKAEVSERALMEQLFQQFIDILPSLEGPDPDGPYRQQMHLLATTRDQLISLAWDTTSDPVIGAGLRAAYNALVAINTRQFPDQTDLSKSLDDVSSKLDELDSQTGDINHQTAADCVKAMGTIMVEMNTILLQRAQPATVPSTEATTEATTEPTTESTTAPSTEPTTDATTAPSTQP